MKKCACGTEMVLVKENVYSQNWIYRCPKCGKRISIYEAKDVKEKKNE